MRLLEIEARAGGSETPLAYSHVNWARMFSPLLDELGATLDHVQAHSSGGPDTNDNFCTACTKCNYRKGKFELAEFLSRNPTKTISSKYGEPQNWDGLSAVFTALAIRHPLELTGADKQWLKVLATIP